jgi:hypothetical protein
MTLIDFTRKAKKEPHPVCVFYKQNIHKQQSIYDPFKTVLFTKLAVLKTNSESNPN